MLKLIPFLLFTIAAYSAPTSIGQYYLEAPALTQEDWTKVLDCRNGDISIHYFEESTNFVVEDSKYINYFAKNSSGNHSLEGYEDAELNKMPITSQSSDADALILGKLAITNIKNTMALMGMGMSGNFDAVSSWNSTKDVFAQEKKSMSMTEADLIREVRSKKSPIIKGIEEVAAFRFNVESYSNKKLKMLIIFGTKNRPVEFTCK